VATHGKYGRRPPYPDAVRPRLWLDEFFQPGAAVPQSVDFCSEVGDWPMSLNNQLGDCTIAAANHVQMAMNQYAHGKCAPWSDDVCLEAYEAVGGYVPGDPATDNGCAMQDVLEYWRTEGIGGDKILAYGALSVPCYLPVRLQALYTFGAIYTGLRLPQSAETQFDNGQPWTPEQGSPIAGGHCVDQQAELQAMDEVRYVSWGETVSANRAFSYDFTEEAWCIISSDFVEVNGDNPDGFDLQAMNEALASLTGTSNPLSL
jgi:hypothetical protein